jgi:hypothetical protein
LIWDEDNCIYVFPSAESAELAIEALDVEVIKAAYDEDGRLYRVEWINPNDYGQALGLIPYALNGVYRFVVSEEMNMPAWLEMIHEASSIMSGECKPNKLVDEYVYKLITLYKV